MGFLRSSLLRSLPIYIALMILMQSARGDCLSRCDPMCDRRQAYCQQRYNECSASCVGKGSHDYGAIAYSRITGRLGFSNKRDTRDEAEDEAIEACKSSDCEVIVWVDGSCGAIATAQDGRVTWGLGNTAREAQINALQECQMPRRGICNVKGSICSRGRAD